MTILIDLRASANGGICAPGATAWQDGRTLSGDAFSALVRGRDLVLATHGFNVDRQDGVQSLSDWEKLCTLPANCLFVGVLWPGDSRYVPVLDYPVEGDEAITSGRHLSAFLNQYAAGAASLSFSSHSLGGRVVLETLAGLNRRARRVLLMAGAIENNCLQQEYRDAAQKADQILVLASVSDWVLHLAFPIGNPIGQIIMHGHPYFRTALGRDGPAQPIPPDQQGGAWNIPKDWTYVHADYLPKDSSQTRVPPPVSQPGQNDPKPEKAAWSARVLSTVLKS
jgi:hypothetical protein